MKRLTRRFLLARAAATTGLAAMPAIHARAQAPVRLTIASLLGEDKPETRIWHRMRDLVGERLPGRFAFNVVPNAALGGEKDVADGIRLGSIQASLLTTASLSGWIPELQLLDMPFLFRDAAHVRATVSGEIGRDMRERLAGQGFIAPDFVNYGARHLLTREPVSRPGQMRGLRMRVIQSPLHVQLWSAFGAVPVAISIPETYNALDTGVVEAMDLTKSAYAGFRLYDVVPCVTETSHIWSSGVICFGASFWNGLGSEEQGILRDCAEEAGRYFDRLMVEDEAASMAAARERGARTVQVESRREWQDIARQIWPDLAATQGGQARIDAVLAVE